MKEVSVVGEWPSFMLVKCWMLCPVSLMSYLSYWNTTINRFNMPSFWFADGYFKQIWEFSIHKCTFRCRSNFCLMLNWSTVIYKQEKFKKNLTKIHYYLKGQILHRYFYWWTHFKHMAVMVFYNVYQSIDNVPMYSYVCTDIISFTIRCIHI